MSPYPGWESRWALPGDHTCAAPLRWCIQDPVVVFAVKHSQWDPCGSLTSLRAIPQYKSGSLWSPSLYWTSHFFFSRKERENMWLQRKFYPGNNLQEARAMWTVFHQEGSGTLSLRNGAGVPPHCGSVAWATLGCLGAPTLRLGCTRLWCLSTLYIPRNKTSSLFQSLSVLEHLELWALVSYLPVILQIIAKWILEVLQERKSTWAMASACTAQARRTWALFKHRLQFHRLEEAWLLGSLYSGCPCKCFYQVALSFS